MGKIIAGLAVFIFVSAINIALIVGTVYLVKVVVF